MHLNSSYNFYTKKIFWIISFVLILISSLTAQEQEKNPALITYFQMQPFDDSLFIKIQNEVFIDPPDPKAEIIVDLRDPNNQTVAIKGALYPFLAFKPETRARIITYPYKIDLEEDINYGSVFTRVLEKMKLSKVISPPSKTQINPALQYINPFLQAYGGERFGFPIKDDIGISIGIGTPYSGMLETNFVEANFHIVGFKGGIFSSVDGLTDLKTKNNHNNLYTTFGIQLGYVVPFGNFLEFSLQDVTVPPSQNQLNKYARYDTLGFKAKVLKDTYFSWEFRYPIQILGSTRSKFYVANYLKEWHVGYTGRELSLGGSTFDVRLDYMPKSDVRQPQAVIEILTQKLFGSWAFSAISLGPSIVLANTDSGNFGLLTVFVNARIKVGTSF